MSMDISLRRLGTEPKKTILIVIKINLTTIFKNGHNVEPQKITYLLNYPWIPLLFLFASKPKI